MSIHPFFDGQEAGLWAMASPLVIHSSLLTMYAWMRLGSSLSNVEKRQLRTFNEWRMLQDVNVVGIIKGFTVNMQVKSEHFNVYMPLCRSGPLS